MNPDSPAPMRIQVPASARAVAVPPPGQDDKVGREDRSALICCHEPAYQEFVGAQLRSLGFKLHHAVGAQAAQQRLAVRSYQVIVLLENLEGCALEDNMVLDYLLNLSTDERRVIYVILLCQSFATGDELNAYAQSVDQVINYKDVPQFAELVGPALEEYEVGNRHFQAILREVNGG